MTTVKKTYSASVFGRQDVRDWRGVSTGRGWFENTPQYVRHSVNLVADDLSLRRREGQRALQREDAPLIFAGRVGNVRAAAIGGSVYVNDFDERERSGNSTITF